MPTGKDAYSEMPTEQQIFHYERWQLPHQPILIAVDVSGSMNHVEDGQVKTNIKLAEEMVNQIGQDPSISDEYKRTTDICVMTFASCVTTVQDWIPLSQYRGGITIKGNGVTAFHDVVKQSLNAVHVMKDSYAVAGGIDCKRPQIFIITDGYSTDPSENPKVVDEAKLQCQKYLDTNKVAMHVILLPGGSTSDSRQLSDKIMHYKVDDCAYGLPATKKFIEASIVAFSSSTIGDKATIQLPEEMKTTQPVNINPNGSRTLQTDVDVWN